MASEYTKSGWRIPSRWEALWLGFLFGLLTAALLVPSLIRFAELAS